MARARGSADAPAVTGVDPAVGESVTVVIVRMPGRWSYTSPEEIAGFEIGAEVEIERPDSAANWIRQGVAMPPEEGRAFLAEQEELEARRAAEARGERAPPARQVAK